MSPLDFSSQVVSSYRMYLSAISGAYLMQVNEFTPHAIASFEASALSLRKTLLETIAGQVATLRGVDEMEGAAYGSEQLLIDLSRVTRDNIETLSGRLRGTNKVMKDGLGDFTGAMGVLAHKKMEQPGFDTLSNGRRFDSTGYVQTQARHFGYGLYLTNAMADMESDIAEVHYSNPAHVNHGLKFSISGQTPGLPSFLSIRDKIFHHNATAGVVEHVPS